jgi:signal transduction histidine kinase
MTFKKRVRNLIIGEDKRIESFSEYKQAMLSGQFALIGMVLCILYSAMDVFLEGIYITSAIYWFMTALFAVSIYFHRAGRHCMANYFLLPTANVGIYLIASSEAPHTGGFIYYIITTLAAFSVFGYRQRILSILFAAFSYVLFIATLFIDFSILPERAYSEDAILLSQVLNFTVALPSAISVVYLMISLNHYNALQLVGTNQQLTKANKELDRFVYCASHDLKAPLDSVKGLLALSRNASTPQQAADYQDLMVQRINSLQRLICEMTELSRNGTTPVTLQPVNIYDIALDVWDTLRFSEEAKKIRFDLNIPKDTVVYSDRSRLRIVLSNLLSNAIRYHDGEKENPFIKLCFSANGHSFYLQVKDNGQGIAREHQSKIFDMFFRANNSSKGTGLGLFIVKETLDKLSGGIRLESEPGKGSVFTLQLPTN